jgi:hypothetical protein
MIVNHTLANCFTSALEAHSTPKSTQLDLRHIAGGGLHRKLRITASIMRVLRQGARSHTNQSAQTKAHPQQRHSRSQALFPQCLEIVCPESQRPRGSGETPFK